MSTNTMEEDRAADPAAAAVAPAAAPAAAPVVVISAPAPAAIPVAAPAAAATAKSAAGGGDGMTQDHFVELIKAADTECYVLEKDLSVSISESLHTAAAFCWDIVFQKKLVLLRFVLT